MTYFPAELFLFSISESHATHRAMKSCRLIVLNFSQEYLCRIYFQHAPYPEVVEFSKGIFERNISSEHLECIIHLSQQIFRPVMLYINIPTNYLREVCSL